MVGTMQTYFQARESYAEGEISGGEENGVGNDDHEPDISSLPQQAMSELS